MQANGAIFPAISAAQKFSNEKFERVTRRLEEANLAANLTLVVVGSYARGEANQSSDFDYFLFEPEATGADGSRAHQIVHQALKAEAISPPSLGGPFGNGCWNTEDFVQNIGGENEINGSLTRRMLLLLESKCLLGHDNYMSLRTELINRYIGDRMTEHGLARFLLNDIIKYYRTVCVDFEYKTVEENKDWGIRNIKLMFSRKLIYFSGVLAVAETAQRFWRDKRQIIETLLSLSPIHRIQETCGSRSEIALRSYDEFLHKMANEKFRAILEKVDANRDTHSSEFRALKNEAHHFSWSLMRLLTESYPATHPIHQALVF